MSEAPKPLGTISDGRKSIFMSTYAGEGTIGKGPKAKKVEMLNAGWGNGPPLIHCQETNKYFLLTWEEIIGLAVTAGILEPFPESAEKVKAKSKR